MHETQNHQSKRDQILGTSPTLKSHSLYVVKEREIPKKRKLICKNEMVYTRESSGLPSMENE